MSSHFKWYPSSEEVVVPWNARYSYPSQANKAIKITPRIPPKNGASFSPGSIIRLEFPAQGYVNPVNTTLEFDVTMLGDTGCTCRFQNNIQSLFNRVRLMYGSTPLEDIIQYNQIVRNLTEWSSSGAQGTIDQISIAEGIGAVAAGLNCKTDNITAGDTPGPVNVRQKFIQGVDFLSGVGCGCVPNGLNASGAVTSFTSTRRYQVNLALGLFTQAKLIPTKFMASQLAIEITLEQPDKCIFYEIGARVNGTYTVQNVNLIPEILEFDSSYDAMFLKGLQDGGVPIKFASWHTFLFGTGNSTVVNLQVQERSRSVKALFACLQAAAGAFTTDNGTTFFDTTASSSMQTYQWRIGGRYFPAQPVELSVNGTASSNGGAEAYLELQKALNVVGDYRLSTACNTLRWSYTGVGVSNDFKENVFCFTTAGTPTTSGAKASTLALAGNMGSQCFASAIDLETSNGIEISGLNAEEQSDIAFLARWTLAQSTSYVINVFSYYDSMLILRENNVMELIQ
jgi:hypothetical protein